MKRLVFNKEAGFLVQSGPGRREWEEGGGLTVADVLAGRESSRNCARVGEQGA